MTDIQQISCTRCGNLMPALRKTKFGYDFCVNCSNVSPKLGISVQKGPGEDTWEETVFISSEDYKIINKHRGPSADVNSFEEEEV